MLGMTFTGLAFALLLWFIPNMNRSANRFLAMAICSVILTTSWLLCKNIRLDMYFPHWSWVLPQFSMAIGPLIYFHVLKITRPEYEFQFRDLLHFSPLLIEWGVRVLEIKESAIAGAPVYNIAIYQRLNPIIQLLVFMSVIIYLHKCRDLINQFNKRVKFNGGDRHRNSMRPLSNLLFSLTIILLLWISFAWADWYCHLGNHIYYPLYLLLSVPIIWIAVSAFLRQENSVGAAVRPQISSPIAPELKQKGTWLKNAMKANSYHRDMD
jgi:hypothetical protein